MKKEVLSQIRQKIGLLQSERNKREKEILNIFSRKLLIRGYLYEKYKACNKLGCKCTKGQKHGPFLYLSNKIEGKTKMIFIKRNLKEKVTELAKNYQKWRKSRAKIAKYNADILSLIDEMEGINTILISTLEPEAEDKE